MHAQRLTEIRRRDTNISSVSYLMLTSFQALNCPKWAGVRNLVNWVRTFFSIYWTRSQALIFFFFFLAALRMPAVYPEILC